ncbi:MAG TPA: glycolate oxidase subunit GlcE [Rhodocyclaceae bacterium]|nr:glycolate oxidase subunit GlcE [Rhodocyclaceae bacterium]
MAELLAQWGERIRAAADEGRALRLRGGGSKDFYGGEPRGEVFDTAGHAGVVAYEPTELYVTARCGTPLAELESVLGGKGQFLACEPPRLPGATVGGTVAAGLSGPRRATAGAVRDFVLGVKLLDGEGRLLTFGGQVMKNVAGYDVSRLVAGSMGTLALIAEVSLKVLPRPVAEATLRFEMPQANALEDLNAWAGRPLPISGSCWQDGLLTLRLSGARAAVDSARAKLGGEALDEAAARAFWDGRRDLTDGFFAGPDPVWRLSLPSVAPVVDAAQGVEWGGALRWWRTGRPAAEVRALAAKAGGHATLFRRGGHEEDAPPFHPLPPAVLALHERLKRAFDPKGILNPGRLHPEL